MEKVNISFNLNGKNTSVSIYPNRRMVDMLRDDFDLTSVKEGCSEGECGACTIIFNGDAVTSCLMLGVQADGSSIVTLEGLNSDGEELHILQKSFMEAGAVQCGFCTPGMILSAKALLDKNPHPSDEEIKRGISGNLCRCTGYLKIVEAVKLAIEEMDGTKNTKDGREAMIL